MRNYYIFVLIVIPVMAEPVPPMFNITPPRERIKEEGQVLHLRCVASGRPAPLITWLKDGYPMKNGQDGVRMSDGRLAISELKRSHEGVYTCRAQNVASLIETSTTVHIKAAPTLVTVPKNTTVRDGEQVMFSCRAVGYPRDILYEWFHHGLPMTSSDKDVDFRALHREGTFTFDVTVPDAGVIGCRAVNGYGKSRIANATLTVKFPARVRKMPAVMYAGLGLRVNLPCPADAVPAVTIATWQRSGTSLSVDKDDRLSLGENGSLVIDPVRESDSSRYSCEPYNSLGTQGRSTEFSLVVYNAPKFTLKPRAEYYAEIGKPLTMACNGTGDPPLYITWVKIDESGEEVAIPPDDQRISVEEGNLTIRSVVKSDHGKLQCVLSNPVRKVRADAMVYVRYTSPHTVTDVKVVTSKYNAQVSWQPGYDGGRPQYFIIWYKRADMGGHSWRTHRVVGYRKVATVGELEPDTIYQFAVMSENDLGSGQFSKEVTVRTKVLNPIARPFDQPTIEPPGRLDYHVTKDGHLVLMWQPPLDTKREDLLGYVVESRMLLADADDGNDVALLADADDGNDVTPAPEDAENVRSGRARREAQLARQWTRWETVDRVEANSTELRVDAELLYRDQMYEFHVIAVSTIVFSAPSAVIAISTKGLNVYPIFVGPSNVTAAASGSNTAVIAIVAAVVAVAIIAAALVSVWCARRRRYRGVLYEDKESLGKKSRDSDSSGSDEGKKSSGKKRSKSLFSLKKKMLDADLQMAHAYSSTDELAGLAREVPPAKKQGGELQCDGKGAGSVRQINRAPDGKFRVSEDRSPRKAPTQTRLSRPRSVEWDTREPLLSPTLPDESLEIDCSHSNIQVRYIKEMRGRDSCQSSSMSSLAGPKQYNLARRQIGPCDKSFDSSVADGSFQSVGDHRRPPYPRQNAHSQSTMPHRQYVQLRHGPDPRGARNPSYRISSPPQCSNYSFNPGSPSKYRQNGRPQYQPTSRDSYSIVPEGLIHDPRYTRIESIKINPRGPHHPPNRHSTYLVDTEVELPNDPHPHRAIQLRSSRTTSTRTEPDRSRYPITDPDTSGYPVPKWRGSEAKYHTLPNQSKIGSKSAKNRVDPDVELSLKRHNANRMTSHKSLPHGAGLSTNSLGRKRQKSHGTPTRRRVHSLDDLTLGGDDVTIPAKKIGSVDLLVPRRCQKSELSPEKDLGALQDAITVGFDAGDEASDVTAHSSVSTLKPSISAGLKQSRSYENQSQKADKTIVTSPREDDSSAVSSLLRVVPEIGSSGYDSHNTSHASSCSPAELAARPHDHDRTSTASSSDRSRKDYSSVDEKYEWDSEYAMETEILEALKNYGNHTKTGSASKAFVKELQKLGIDKVRDLDQEQLAGLEQAAKSRDQPTSDGESDRSATVDTSDMYTKESMERRCAVLKKEFQRYQMEQSRASNQEARMAANSANV